ncbi:hypothetical protein LC55x_3146 [Lysobacter capsici]|nr:hypothetical protein LC55x_3146 [Lysobacter capsici]
MANKRANVESNARCVQPPGARAYHFHRRQRTTRSPSSSQ